jgi:hypothetical protein
MSEEHGTLEAFGVIFVCWGTVFFGVWVFPLDNMAKCLIDLGTSVLFIMFGLSYFTYKNKIQWAKHSSLIRKAYLGVVVIFVLIEAALGFYLSIVFWEVFSIDGVHVITYQDIVSLLLGASSVFLTAYAARIIKNRNKYLL